MSGQKMPPWLQEKVEKLRNTQENLRNAAVQRQQLEADRMEADKALEELQKASDGDIVYKLAGGVMVQSTRKDLIDDLEETQLLNGSRLTVLGKQEERLKKNYQEQESELDKALRGKR